MVMQIKRKCCVVVVTIEYVAGKPEVTAVGAVLTVKKLID